MSTILRTTTILCNIFIVMMILTIVLKVELMILLVILKAIVENNMIMDTYAVPVHGLGVLSQPL